MKKTKMLTEGALMLAVFTILLLIFNYIPFLSLIAVAFLLLPFILYSAKYPLKYSFILLIGGIIISALVGTLLLIPVAIAYGTTGMVIGYSIQKKKSKTFLYIAASIMFLLNTIGQYIVSVVLFKIDILKDTIKMVRESMNKSMQIFEAVDKGTTDQLMDQFNTILNSFTTLLPSLLVIASFLIIWILLSINLPIARRFQIDAPKWNSFRDLQLPRSILWYYLITIILTLILRPEQGDFLNTALANLNFVLQLLMLLQGLSFLFFYSYEKKWPKAIPVLIIIFSFLLFPLQYLIRILGIMDLGFNLRQLIKRKSP
ncbi:YybS family protein [Heyndrickxia vini]|uniref:YybS family protein n=1 Tax=Heyndrickxia vini TaxID=1476025 RepID=A0ABX7E277_9BACI|nr:YybS family protein [Heyndrickxia vini]QQZ09435.1 YybS family protein [Heyndrickxia vini]